MTRPRSYVSRIRWLIRREAYREPRFGETRRDVVRWAVRTYIAAPNGRRTFLDVIPTYFASLSKAHAYATSSAQRLYGDRTTTRQASHRQNNTEVRS